MKKEPMTSIEIRLGSSWGMKLPSDLKKAWKPIAEVFGDTFQDNYIVFLAEVLSLIADEKTVFSGYKEYGGMGLDEERWNLRAGKTCIFRSLSSELSDGWQRVEKIGDVTSIIDIPPGRFFSWDGNYDSHFGMRLVIGGLDEKKLGILRNLTTKLFKDYTFENTATKKSEKIRKFSRQERPAEQPKRARHAKNLKPPEKSAQFPVRRKKWRLELTTKRSSTGHSRRTVP